jgi:hypothetical protein
MLLDERRRDMEMMLTILAGFGTVWLVVLLAAGVAASLSRLNFRA